MSENSLEQLQRPEKEKGEMSPEEVEKMGAEMEDYYTALRQEAVKIKKELSDFDIGSERAEELCDSLELIEMQLGEDWEGFVEDIKLGDWSEAKIEKE